jgi:hypothetical protein
MSWAMNFLIGSFVLIISLYGSVNPYRTARFFEQVDAIGSKRRRRDVEPTNWNVRATQVSSILMAICSGVFVILMIGALR